MLLQLASERLVRGSAVAFFTGPLAAGLVGLALLIGLAPGAEPSAGRNIWLILHVALVSSAPDRYATSLGHALGDIALLGLLVLAVWALAPSLRAARWPRGADAVPD